MNAANTNGPYGDGSRSLATESKVGQLVNAVLTSAALGVAGYIGGLDLSTLPGWANAVGVVLASTAVATLTAWATRNRRA